MIKKLIIVYLMLQGLICFCDENIIAKPESKLFVKKFNEAADQNGNIFTLYNKPTLMQVINPEFISIFTKNDANVLLFSKYLNKIQITNSMLNLGILGCGLMAGMLAELPLMFVGLYYGGITEFIFNLMVGVLSGAAGEFLIMAIVGFILFAVFQKQAKDILKQMVNNYNQSNNFSYGENIIDKRLDICSIKFKF